MIEKIKHEKYKILKRNIIGDSDFTKETMFILICAMIIASIGLNTNSVAVIIGAMLISATNVTNSVARIGIIKWKFKKSLCITF